jgi:hypothetical protein
MLLSFITSILSLLVTLGIAYGIDYGYFLVRRYAIQMGKGELIFIFEFFGGLLLGVVWLILGWWVKTKSRQNLVTAMIHLVIGLIAFAWFPLSFLGPRFLAIVYEAVFIFPNQPVSFQFSGIFIIVLGFLTMRRLKK